MKFRLFGFNKAARQRGRKSAQDNDGAAAPGPEKIEAIVARIIDAEDAAAREAARRDAERRDLMAKTRSNAPLTPAESALLAAAGLAPEDAATTAAREGRSLAHNARRTGYFAAEEKTALISEARK